MTAKSATWKAAWAASAGTLVLIAGFAYAQAPAPAKKAPAVSESQAQASAILMGMADFLGSAKGFSVTIRAGYDAVQQSGQKIEFGETRKVILSRPDRLRVEGERSDGARMLTVFLPARRSC